MASVCKQRRLVGVRIEAIQAVEHGEPVTRFDEHRLPGLVGRFVGLWHGGFHDHDPGPEPGPVGPGQHLCLETLDVHLEEVDGTPNVVGHDLRQRRDGHLDRSELLAVGPVARRELGHHGGGAPVDRTIGVRPRGFSVGSTNSFPSPALAPSATRRFVSAGRAAHSRWCSRGSGSTFTPRHPRSAKAAVTESNTGSPAPTSTQKPRRSSGRRARASTTSSRFCAYDTNGSRLMCRLPHRSRRHPVRRTRPPPVASCVPRNARSPPSPEPPDDICAVVEVSHRVRPGAQIGLGPAPVRRIRLGPWTDLRR